VLAAAISIQIGAVASGVVISGDYFRERDRWIESTHRAEDAWSDSAWPKTTQRPVLTTIAEIETAELSQLSDNAEISPTGVLPRETHDEFDGLDRQRWPTRLADRIGLTLCSDHCAGLPLGRAYITTVGKRSGCS
jgi:hypothetical protein